MKFLQSGDSVVSLRFKYLAGGPESGHDYVDIPDTLEFDTAQEIQDAIVDLFPKGAAVPQNLLDQAQELADVVSDPNAEIDQGWLFSRLSEFQNSLNGALSAETHYPDIHPFMDALSEFCYGFIEIPENAALQAEKNELMAGVESQAAAAETRLAMAELVGDITSKGLERDAERTNDGQRTPDKPVASFVAKAEELPQVIAQAEQPVGDYLESLQAELDQTTLGGFYNFDPAQVA